jgi:hypothetical protein
VKRIVLGIILLCGGILTGCTQLVDLSDQESDVVAEYIAGTYLKHSGYENALIYTEKEETLDVTQVSSGIKPVQDETEPVKPENNQNTTNSTSGNNVGNTNINEVIGTEDFEITYTDFDLLDSYPSTIGDEYFNLEPSTGNQLLLLRFTVKNKTNKAKNFNLINQKLVYTLSNQSGDTYLPMITLLTDDIQFINVDIAAGEIYNAVVVYDVPKDVNTTDIRLEIKNADKYTIIALN